MHPSINHALEIIKRPCSTLNRVDLNASQFQAVRTHDRTDLQYPEPGRSQCITSRHFLQISNMVALQYPEPGRSQCIAARRCWNATRGWPCSTLSRVDLNASPSQARYSK